MTKSLSLHPVDIEIGERLRVRRIIAGLTQEELGRRLGVSMQQIGKYETGANPLKPSRLLAAADTLEVHWAYFFEGHGAPTTPGACDLAEHAEALAVAGAIARCRPADRARLAGLARALADRDSRPAA